MSFFSRKKTNALPNKYKTAIMGNEARHDKSKSVDDEGVCYPDGHGKKKKDDPKLSFIGRLIKKIAGNVFGSWLKSKFGKK